jgi:hypothetical protein
MIYTPEGKRIKLLSQCDAEGWLYVEFGEGTPIFVKQMHVTDLKPDRGWQEIEEALKVLPKHSDVELQRKAVRR